MSQDRTPFAHQRHALDVLNEWRRKRESLPKENAGGIVVLPTGGGKTFTAIRFLCSTLISQGYKVLWLAHTHHLREQAFESFDNSVGKIGEPNTHSFDSRGFRDPRSLQSCRDQADRRCRRGDLADDDTCLRRAASSTDRLPEIGGWTSLRCVRRVHHAPAPSYRKMLTALRSEYAPILLLGLTATPIYSDPRKQGWLRELFPQGIIHQSMAKDLLANKILAQPIFEKVATEVA